MFYNRIHCMAHTQYSKLSELESNYFADKLMMFGVPELDLFNFPYLTKYDLEFHFKPIDYWYPDTDYRLQYIPAHAL